MGQVWGDENMSIWKGKTLRLKEVRVPRQPDPIAWKGACYVRVEFVKPSTDASFPPMTP